MANSELHIKDSATDKWRQMTSNDLATVKNNGTATVTPAGKSFLQRNSVGNFTAVPATLFAIYISVDGATAGDTFAIKDNATVIVTFVCTGTGGNFSFLPSVGVSCSTNINVGTDFAGSPTWTATAVYEDV